MSTPTRTKSEAGTILPCYHCGDAVPKGVDYQVQIAGQSQPMCCVGCRAVAQLIDTSGLENFYQQRTALNVRPDLSDLESEHHYALYNDPLVNRAFRQDEFPSTESRLPRDKNGRIIPPVTFDPNDLLSGEPVPGGSRTSLSAAESKEGAPVKLLPP